MEFLFVFIILKRAILNVRFETLFGIFSGCFELRPTECLDTAYRRHQWIMM